MVSLEEKQRLLDDLLAIDESAHVLEDGRGTESTVYAATLFGVLGVLSFFPETFYFLAGKLVGLLRAKLIQLDACCAEILSDLPDLVNASSVEEPDTAPLDEAAAALKFISAKPTSGDPAYRRYKRAIARFGRRNRQLLVGGLAQRRDALEANRDLRLHVETIRTARDWSVKFAGYLVGALARFKAVGWTNYLGGKVAGQSISSLEEASRQLKLLGRQTLQSALFTAITTEELLEALLENPRGPEDAKWAGTISTLGPYTSPRILGTKTAPFSVVGAETFQYKVDGVEHNWELDAALKGPHIYIPHLDFYSFEPEVSDLLYVYDKTADVTYRFPGEFGDPPNVGLGDGDAATVAVKLIDGHPLGDWLAIVPTSPGGIILYSPGVLAETTYQITYCRQLMIPVPGALELRSAHENLGLFVGQEFAQTFGEWEAAEVFGKAEHITLDVSGACLLGSPTATAESKIEIMIPSDAMGFSIGQAVATSSRAAKESGGRITPGDEIVGLSSSPTILEVPVGELLLDTELAVGDHAVSIIGPEVADYVPVEGNARTFLAALDALGLRTSFGALDKLSPTPPDRGLVVRIGVEITQLREAIGTLISALASYAPRRDDLTEVLLQGLDERGYERASFLLRTCQFFPFIRTSYLGAASEGAILEAISDVAVEVAPSAFMDAEEAEYLATYGEVDNG